MMSFFTHLSRSLSSYYHLFHIAHLFVFMLYPSIGHHILITFKGWHTLFFHLYNSHTPSEWNDMLHGGIT